MGYSTYILLPCLGVFLSASLSFAETEIASTNPEPMTLKEADFHAEKEKAETEKEQQIFGKGLSISAIVDYTERARLRLRRGQQIDITKKFKPYSSMMREVHKRNFVRVLNLEGASFSGDDMSRTNFSMSHLVDSNFKDADLSYAVFAYADLSGANFTGANLKNTDFSNAILEGANFSGAQLQGTNFYKAEIDDIQTLTPKDEEIIAKSVEYYRVNKTGY